LREQSHRWQDLARAGLLRAPAASKTFAQPKRDHHREIQRPSFQALPWRRRQRPCHVLPRLELQPSHKTPFADCINYRRRSNMTSLGIGNGARRTAHRPNTRPLSVPSLRRSCPQIDLYLTRVRVVGATDSLAENAGKRFSLRGECRKTISGPAGAARLAKQLGSSS
jgi:hypothetical protein